jgi:hypothetical protein
VNQPTPHGNVEEGATPHVNAEAGIAGGSSGTLLAYLADNLADDHWFKSWLLILAPSTTLVIAYLWSRLRFRIDDYFDQREARAYLNRALSTLQEGIDDPNTPEAQREEWRRDVAALRRDFINENTARFRSRLKRWRKK